jgi:hypothetical protein
MLNDIDSYYKKINEFAVNYGENQVNEKQHEFYSKLISLRILRDSENYGEAVSKLDNDGLTKYKNMISGLLSLLLDGRQSFENTGFGIPIGRREGFRMNERIFRFNDQQPQPNNTPSMALNAALLSSRLTYTDMGLPAIGPCYMRALMAIAETNRGRNLTPDEFNQLHTAFTSGSNPAVMATDGNGNVSYYVQRPKEVIEATLNILEPGNYSVSIDDTASESTIGSLREVSTTGHWQEGDKDGNFRWDGYFGLANSDVNISQTRYVSIERLPD